MVEVARMELSVLAMLVVGLLLSVGTHAKKSKPTKRPQISFLHINSDIKFRYATTEVISRMKNPDEVSREVTFDVTLPNEAFITNLTLTFDNKTIVGEIKEKAAAKEQYETAKQAGQSAGYIGTRPRETNRFNLAVNVAAMDKVEFKLTYQELLKRKRGHYEQVIYINPGEPVEDMFVSVAIQESRKIINLKSPRLSNDIDTDEGLDISDITSMTYPSENEAFVKFAPSVEYQQKQSDNGMAGKFVVQYDIERHNDAGEILMVNGYFVHFFAPTGYTRLPNDVLFILDTSGSMSGTKMKQLKKAMASILGQLSDGDRFNILTFSSGASLWQETMQDISDEDIKEEAHNYIKSLQTGGWTNIEASFTKGLQFLSQYSNSMASEETRSSIIVFLTDGEATSGVTDTDELLKIVKKQNEGGIPIFSLAFGEYADYQVVKKVALQNNGFGRKIYEASDASLQISGFYNEIAVTLMNNVTFRYLDAEVKNVTKHTYPNYFDGSEIIVCGFYDPRYRSPVVDGRSLPSGPSGNDFLLEDGDISYDPLSGVLRMEITGETVDGPTTVAPTSTSILDATAFDNATDSFEFERMTEKVWAYLTIKQLLDDMVGSLDEEEKKAIEKKALDLSLRYGFVTPLTSMVVTTPDEEKPTPENENEGADDVTDIPQPRPLQSGLVSSDNDQFFHRPKAAMMGRIAPQSSNVGAGSVQRHKPQYSMTGMSVPSGQPGLPSFTGIGYPDPVSSHSGHYGRAFNPIFHDPTQWLGTSFGPPATHIVPTPTTRPNKTKRPRHDKGHKKNKKGRKDRKKDRKARKQDTLPLVVNVEGLDHPLCFDFTSTAPLITNSSSYVLIYEDAELQVRAYVNSLLYKKGKGYRLQFQALQIVSKTMGGTSTVSGTSQTLEETGDTLPLVIQRDRSTKTTRVAIRYAPDVIIRLENIGHSQRLYIETGPMKKSDISFDGIVNEIRSRGLRKVAEKTGKRSSSKLVLLKSKKSKLRGREKFTMMEKTIDMGSSSQITCWQHKSNKHSMFPLVIKY